MREKSAQVISGDLSTGVVETSQRLVKEVIQYWGRLDLLVNNAGVYEKTPLEAANDHLWDLHMNVNAKAPYFLAQVKYHITIPTTITTTIFILSTTIGTVLPLSPSSSPPTTNCCYILLLFIDLHEVKTAYYKNKHGQ